MTNPNEDHEAGRVANDPGSGAGQLRPGAEASPPLPPVASSAGPVDDAVLEAPESEEEAKDRLKRSRPFWVEVPLLVATALVIAVVITTFLFQAFYIPSGSMQDTLSVNDRILVNKLAFSIGDPHRGDVIVFDSGTSREESLLEGIRRNVAEAVGLSAPESDFIKRVVGLPGEMLEIRANIVYIDGRVLNEPYLRAGAIMGDFGPVVVEEDAYFMMGDDRNASNDSRIIGTVSRDRLVGRAFVIVWPPGNWSGI